MKSCVRKVLNLVLMLDGLVVYAQPGVAQAEPVPLEGTSILIFLGAILGIWYIYRRRRRTI